MTLNEIKTMDDLEKYCHLNNVKFSYPSCTYEVPHVKVETSHGKIEKYIDLYSMPIDAFILHVKNMIRTLNDEPLNLSELYIQSGRCNGKTAFIANMFKKAYGELVIEKVIFNDPATIVFWADGTKTVVKAQNEDFDPEKGLAMAIAKKALGNKGNYCNEIKKWTEPYLEERSLIDEVISNVRQATARLKHHVDQSNLRAARHFLKQARVPKTTKSVMIELIDDSIEILDKVLDE